MNKMNNTNLDEYRTKCPIKMSDGRIFTDYRPRCAVNSELMTDLSNNNMIKSSYESRVFLQSNAEKIIEMNKMNATNNLTPCAPCNRPVDVSGTMYPERYIVKCTPSSCEKIEVNKHGLGTSTRVQM
jgi:hypothetical protein